MQDLKQVQPMHGVTAKTLAGRTRRGFDLRWSAVAAVLGAFVCVSVVQAQVPAVIASSPVNLTPTGGVGAGRAVIDNCGNIYVNENGGPVVQIQPGTGKVTIVSANTNGYNNGQGLAIDSTKTHLYFPTPAQWYSSSFTMVPLTNCVPGGGTTLGGNASSLFSYYYGTASNIAVDGMGDVFFTATSGSGKIGELPATGNPSLALTGWPNAITSLAADAAGNLYFTDGSIHVYQLKAGYTAAPAFIGTGFNKPVGVSVDGQGNLYISDNGNSLVYEIPLEKVGTTSALNPADQFTVASVAVTNQVAVDASQNIYVANSTGNVIEELIGAAAVPGTQFGQTSSAVPINYLFNASVTPATISVNSGTAASTAFAKATGGCVAGTTYTAGNSCSVSITYKPTSVGLQMGAVVLADATGAALNTTLISGLGLGASLTVDPGKMTQLTGTFKTPKGAVVDSQGSLYVADAGNNTVVKYAAGSATGAAVSTGTITLNGPSGVAVDGAGDVFIADSGNNQIVEVPVVKGALSGAGAVAVGVTVKSPGGVAVDGQGNLYVADTGNNRLLYVPNHNGVLNAALAQPYGTGFSGPLAVAVDANRNVFVADSGNNAVQELAGPIGSQGQVKVVAGLSGPSGLSTDASGSLYVVDKGSASVFKYPNTSGTLGVAALVGGTIAAPYGVAADASGNLFVTDSTNAVVDQIARVQTSLPFGGWNVGTTSTPLTAIVSDSGNQPVAFNSPSYKASVNTAAGFAVTNDGCASAGTVVAGLSCNIVATFTPPALETNAEEDLTLSSNAANAPTVALVGTGEKITASTLTLALTSPAAGTTLNVGVPVTFVATLGQGSNTAAPGGTVTFYVNGGQVRPATALALVGTTYQAKLTLSSGLPAGSSVIVSAVYSGDLTNYSGSSASLTEAVYAIPTNLVLAVGTPFTNPASAADNSKNAAGPPIVLTASLAVPGSIIPTGFVTFYSGAGSSAKPLGIASVVSGSGGAFTATLTTTALRAGTTNVVENLSTLSNYTLYGVYSGDGSYGSSTSNSAPVTIVAPPVTPPACAVAVAPTATTPAIPATCELNTTGATFTITPSNPTITVASSKLTGQGTGSALLTVTSYGGWSGVLNFTCAGLPAYATCAPYPGAPLVNASTPTASTVPTTVQFIINTNVQPLPPTASGFAWWLSGLLGLALLAARRRLKRMGLGGAALMASVMLLIVASVGGMTGCTTGTMQDITPAGTSNVTVTVNAAQVVAGSSNGSVQLKDSNVSSFQVSLTVQ